MIAIIIPALNEEKSIAKVLKNLPWRKDFRLLVVDNGSTDKTGAIASALGAEVLLERRKGYGQACLAGINSLRDEEIVVFLDGDFSDYPDHIDELLNPIFAEKADLVIGSRTSWQESRRGLTLLQRLGNRLACALIHHLFGFQYSDLGPFRAIRTSSLRTLEMQDTDFGWTVEMQVKALLRGLKVREVSVRYRPRIGQSKISGTLPGSLRAGIKIIYVIFKLKWQNRRDLLWTFAFNRDT